MYCKDASKKVRAAKAVLDKQGKYIASFAPFGYKKSEDDKHVLVPDPVTAPVITRDQMAKNCRTKEENRRNRKSDYREAGNVSWMSLMKK